jgi:hypothetical protein
VVCVVTVGTAAADGAQAAKQLNIVAAGVIDDVIAIAAATADADADAAATDVIAAVIISKQIKIECGKVKTGVAFTHHRHLANVATATTYHENE